MMIRFSGFSDAVEVDTQKVSVLEIHNRTLFARVYSALNSQRGAEAVEPYSLWEGDERQTPAGWFISIQNPCNLPWDHRLLEGALGARLTALVHEDDTVRLKLEEHFRVLQEDIGKVALQLQSEYAFDLEWDMKRYMKTFGFGVDVIDDEPLLEKQIKFLKTAQDVGLKSVLLFVNLKLFFDKKAIEEIYDQAVFSGLKLLLLETVPDDRLFSDERKYIIDQDLLELWPSKPADSSVSLQEGICSNGFGAVTI